MLTSKKGKILAASAFVAALALASGVRVQASSVFAKEKGNASRKSNGNAGPGANFIWQSSNSRNNRDVQGGGLAWWAKNGAQNAWNENLPIAGASPAFSGMNFRAPSGGFDHASRNSSVSQQNRPDQPISNFASDQNQAVPNPNPVVPTIIDQTASNAQPGGMVSINFDDGWQSAYDKGAPILDAVGIKATYFIISGSVGTANYMTWDEIRNLQNSGNEIGDHTRTHPDFTAISDDQAKAEIDEGFSDLQAQGITPDSFAYPYGQGDSADQTAIMNDGMQDARTSGTEFLLNDSSANHYAIYGQSLTNDMTFAEIKSNIDEAMKEGKWYIITLHSVDNDSQDPYNISSSTLQQIVDYLKQNNVKVVTNAEGISAL